MNRILALVFIGLLGSLSGCGIILDGINAYGLKHHPDDYVFTKPDGTTYREWNLAKDGRNELKEDSIYLRKFDLAASARWDTTTRRRTHMELTVTNLKQVAAQNQITIFVRWFPGCGPSIQSSFYPIVDMLSKLKKEGIAFNNSNVGLVLGSVSYHPARADYYLNKIKFPYQSYVIPSPVYPEKILLKEIFFNRELCPECYATGKDDISKYFVFALDKNGKVVDKVAARYDDVSIAPDLERFAKTIKASIL